MLQHTLEQMGGCFVVVNLDLSTVYKICYETDLSLNSIL